MSLAKLKKEEKRKRKKESAKMRQWKKTPSLETLQIKKGKSDKRGKKYKQILSKNEFRTKAEKEKGKEMEKSD